MATLKLSNGNEIPQIGFGTFDNTDKSELVRSIEVAIESGYRHFDCAWLYQNEELIGDTFKNCIEKGMVKREELFITSKLWSTFHQPKDVKPIFMETLKNLKLDYLDLYLMHLPCGFKNDGRNPYPAGDDGFMISDPIDYVITWKAMQKLVDEGLVKQIGVSNFNVFQLKRLTQQCGAPPVINQIEVHPYLPQNDIVDFCKANGIVVTAYGPLGAPGRPWKKDSMLGSTPSIIKNPTILAIAEKYNKNAGQVCLRYLVQKGLAVIPKSATESRIKGNIQVFDFELTNEEVNAINALGKINKRFYIAATGDFPFDYTKCKYFPFPIGEYTE